MNAWLNAWSNIATAFVLFAGSRGRYQSTAKVSFAATLRLPKVKSNEWVNFLP